MRKFLILFFIFFSVNLFSQTEITKNDFDYADFIFVDFKGDNPIASTEKQKELIEEISKNYKNRSEYVSRKKFTDNAGLIQLRDMRGITEDLSMRTVGQAIKSGKKLNLAGIIFVEKPKFTYFKPSEKDKKYDVKGWFFENKLITREKLLEITELKKRYEVAYKNWKPMENIKNENNFYLYMKSNEGYEEQIDYVDNYKDKSLKEKVVGSIIDKEKKTKMNLECKIILISKLQKSNPVKKVKRFNYKLADSTTWVETKGDESELREIDPEIFRKHFDLKNKKEKSVREKKDFEKELSEKFYEFFIKEINKNNIFFIK